MKNYMLVALAAGSLFLGGCASTKIGNPTTFTPVPLDDAEIMPTKADLAGKRLKVVVFEANDKEIPLAEEARTGFTVAQDVEKIIVQTGLEAVDRNVLDEFKDELTLAEMRGQANYQGPQVVDFAIRGAISQATSGSSFEEARQWRDKDGNVHRTPAQCNYGAEVRGKLDIYKMPSVSPVATIAIEGTASASQETRSSDCSATRESHHGLVRAAAQDAVDGVSDDLRNFFAGRGYVLERRDREKGPVFKISIGSQNGAKQGGKVQIFQLVKSSTALTDATIETYQVADGVISDQVGPGYSWIIVKDAEKAEHIRLGHEVRLFYNTTLLDKVKDVANSFNK